MVDATNDLIGLIGIASGDEAVLVGGMAVEFWRSYYGIELRTPSLTTDIDFFADRTFVIDSVKRLRASGEKAKEFLSSMDDATPNSGKVAVYRENAEPIEIEYLYSIGNLSDDDIEGKAVRGKIGGKEVRVVNPLILLEMKIGNLARYPSKRDAAGQEQARIAILAAGMFLASGSNPREVLNAAERIIRFSAKDAACYSRHDFKLDPMQSITEKVLEVCGNEFRSIRLPQALAWIHQRQEKFDAMIARMKRSGAKPSELRF